MRIIVLFIAILLPGFALGQESRPVECRFLTFGGSGESASVLTRSGDGGEIACPLSATAISPRIVCQAVGGKITFLSPDDRKTAAVATIPPGVEAAILVFVEPPKNAEAPAGPHPWRVVVIEDSEENFPDGGAFIANFYNRDIRFVIGEHKGMLRPAGTHGYERPARRDDFNMAPVVFEFRQGEKWRKASESTLRFLPGMRYLIFAYVDPVSSRPRIRTFQDVALPEPPRE